MKSKAEMNKQEKESTIEFRGGVYFSFKEIIKIIIQSSLLSLLIVIPARLFWVYYFYSFKDTNDALDELNRMNAAETENFPKLQELDK